MQLLQVDLLQPQVLQTRVSALQDVIVWENHFNAGALLGRPDSIHGRNFRRQRDLGRGLADDLPAEPFAVAVAQRHTGGEAEPIGIECTLHAFDTALDRLRR